MKNVCVNKNSRNLIVALVVIVSIGVAGALGIYVKADNSKTYDVSDLKRHTSIKVDASGELQIKRTKRENEISMGKKDSWTILVYMDGSDLEMCYGNGTKDIKEMMAANISDTTVENVNIIIQTGGCSLWKTMDVDGTKGQRFRVDNRNKLTLIDEFETKNMGEADTLYDFLNWGIEKYPAEHMGVVFWNHGNGVAGGVCTDKRDSLMVPELEYAFAKVSKNMTSNFDIIGFDTCLAGSIEYANALAPYADYMIASANTEPGEGWNYQEVLNQILNEPSTSAKELGKVICDSYYETLSQQNANARLTIAMYDLNKVDEVCKNFNKLLKYMYEKVTKDESDYNRFNSMQIAPERITYGADKENMDIGSLLYYFDTTCSYDYNTSEFKAALDELVTYKRLSSIYDNYRGAGISIYYPAKALKMSEYAVMRNVLFSPYHLKFLEYIGYKRSNGYASNYQSIDWETSKYFYEDDFEFINYYRNTSSDDNTINHILSSNPKYVEDGFVAKWMSNFGKSMESGGFGKYNRNLRDNTLCRLSSREGIDWILPDGQDLTAYVENSLGETIYSIPVVINDIEMTIKIKEKIVDGRNIYDVLGVWDATIDSEYEGRGYLPLEIGTVVIPIYDVYNEKTGKYESEYGEEYTIKKEFDFLMAINDEK